MKNLHSIAGHAVTSVAFMAGCCAWFAERDKPGDCSYEVQRANKTRAVIAIVIAIA